VEVPMTDELDLTAFTECLFSAEEREWICKFGSPLRELMDGKRLPKTEAQSKFLRVCRGEAPPSTKAEELWIRLLLARSATELRQLVVRRDALLRAMSSLPRLLLIQSLGLELLENSDHPDMLRICVDHYLKDDPTNPIKAVPLALRASDLGDGECAYVAGMLYEHGVGIPADGERAMHYYDLAAKRGIEQAKIKVLKRSPRPDLVATECTTAHLRWNISGVNAAAQDDGDWDFRDDFDAAKWEHIMGGPEDSYFEQ
jgi:hypothetical protein